VPYSLWLHGSVAPSVLGFCAMEPWIYLLRRGLRRALSAVVVSSVEEEEPITVGWEKDA
jgi:hypothetical protein